MMTSADLIPAAVLKRKAVVYVRQSTQSQVMTNLEGQRRQYDLVEVARQWGLRQRFRLRQFLLPTEQDTRRYPIAARHLQQAGARPRRFLNDPALVRFTELPPMTLACRRHDRT